MAMAPTTGIFPTIIARTAIKAEKGGTAMPKRRAPSREAAAFGSRFPISSHICGAVRHILRHRLFCHWQVLLAEGRVPPFYVTPALTSARARNDSHPEIPTSDEASDDRGAARSMRRRHGGGWSIFESGRPTRRIEYRMLLGISTRPFLRLGEFM